MNVNVSPDYTLELSNIYQNTYSFFLKPVVFFVVVLSLIAFSLFYILGNKNETGSTNTETSGSSGSDLSFYIVIFAILGFLLAIQSFVYLSGYNVTSSVKNFFNSFGGKPEVDIVLEKQQATQWGSGGPGSQGGTVPVPVPTGSESEMSNLFLKKQVFNIPGNYYSYDDATSLCKAYGGRLASYDEVEKAYSSGAEWCNYGWSQGQMALFPTQKLTWTNLQKIKGHENDCGRPGINGGYIANSNVKFGVNCYAHKPKINKEEEEMMEIATPYPKTAEDVAEEEREAYWKNKLGEILVSPFNYDKWSS